MRFNNYLFIDRYRQVFLRNLRSRRREVEMQQTDMADNRSRREVLRRFHGRSTVASRVGSYCRCPWRWRWDWRTAEWAPPACELAVYVWDPRDWVHGQVAWCAVTTPATHRWWCAPVDAIHITNLPEPYQRTAAAHLPTDWSTKQSYAKQLPVLKS